MARKKPNETWCIAVSDSDPDALLFEMRLGRHWICRYKTEAAARRQIKSYAMKTTTDRPVLRNRVKVVATEDRMNKRFDTSHSRRIRRNETRVSVRARKYLEGASCG